MIAQKARSLLAVVCVAASALLVWLLAKSCDTAPADSEQVDAAFTRRLGAASPAPSWLVVSISSRAQAGVLFNIAREITSQVSCPDPLPDGALTTYPCPGYTHNGRDIDPNGWTTSALGKPVQCAPGLYELPIPQDYLPVAARLKTLCANAFEAGTIPTKDIPRCNALLGLPGLLSDAAHAAVCAAARAEAGADRFCDGGNCDPPDDFGDGGP